MGGWDGLLDRLAESPRENGTAAVHETARFLADALAEAGVAVERVAFTAQPYGLRLAGVAVLAGGLWYLREVRAGRYGRALALAVALPVLLLVQIDYQVPVLGWLGAETQHHVVGRLPAQQPVQRLVFAAHYDTKTDLLDHLQRAPVEALALPLISLMIVGALGGLLAGRAGRFAVALRRLAATAGFGAAVYGVATFASLSAGALLPDRSPGALDDGAACAVLVRLAEALAAGPPLARTEVEIALLSAEEVGVQGSWAWASERFASPPRLPTAVVNLEGLGASPQHLVLDRETFTLRAFAPDPELVERLDRAHRAALGTPLGRTPYGGATDARAFLAHGVPAATLITLEPGTQVTRRLHSPADDRSRIDEAALDASLAVLLAVVRDAEASGP